jgi:hypothetical protein
MGTARLAVGEKQRVLLPYDYFTLSTTVHKHLAHQLPVQEVELHSFLHLDCSTLCDMSLHFPNESQGTTNFDHRDFAQTHRLQILRTLKKHQVPPPVVLRTGKLQPKVLKIERLRAWSERIGSDLEMIIISIL